MELQAEAERRKRASILSSEGERLSEVNVAEGTKKRQVLLSEAARSDAINRAEGEAQSILLKAEATSTAISKIADTIEKHKMNRNENGTVINNNNTSGDDAIKLMIAEQYVDAFSKLAKESNTIIMNNAHGVNDVAGMVATAMGIYDKTIKSNSKRQQNISSSIDPNGFETNGTKLITHDDDGRNSHYDSTPQKD